MPASVRQRIKGARREKVEQVKPDRPGQKLWQCCACGEVLTSWAASERHCDEQGHRRIELILDAHPPAPSTLRNHRSA